MRRIVAVTVVLLFAAACQSGQNPSIGEGSPTGPPQTDLTVVAKDTKFDPTTLTAPAGKALTITFKNEDAAQHSFHLMGGSAGDVKTDVKQGPVTEKLQVTLRVAASYAYQCDVHPSAMKGTLVVVKASS